jgi:hypothetical protein
MKSVKVVRLIYVKNVTRISRFLFGGDYQLLPPFDPVATSSFFGKVDTLLQMEQNNLLD